MIFLSEINYKISNFLDIMKPFSLLLGVAFGDQFKSEKFGNSDVNILPVEKSTDSR